MSLPISFPQFSVKPYANIPQAKRGRFDPADDCCICGRSMRKHGGQVWIGSGGSAWATTGEGPNDAGWMGSANVGSDCWKRFYTHDVPSQEAK